jgi:hypothetical protein
MDKSQVCWQYRKLQCVHCLYKVWFTGYYRKCQKIEEKKKFGRSSWLKFLFVTRIRIFFLHKHRRYPLLRNKPPRTFIFSELINLFVMSDNEAFLSALKLRRNFQPWWSSKLFLLFNFLAFSVVPNSENINVRGGLLRSKGYRRCLCRKKIRIRVTNRKKYS